jgi:hypothetical protein
MQMNATTHSLITFAEWYRRWSEGSLVDIPARKTPIAALFESYTKHCANASNAGTTLTKFAAYLDAYAARTLHRSTTSRGHTQMAAPLSHPDLVDQQAQECLPPARLINAYAQLDASCLDDRLLAVMATVEDGLIKAGFVPDRDYSRKDLFVQAMPIIHSDWTRGLMKITVAPAAPKIDN